MHGMRRRRKDPGLAPAPNVAPGARQHCSRCDHNAPARAFRKACILCELEVCGPCVFALAKYPGVTRLWYCSADCEAAYKVVASMRPMDMTLVPCPWCQTGPPLVFRNDACRCVGTGNVSIEYLHMYRLFHDMPLHVSKVAACEARMAWRKLTPKVVVEAE